MNEELLPSSPHLTFQFTPLREGRRFRVLLEKLSYAISIHAPPRGATKKLKEGIKGIYISIHAPPRGATKKLKEGIKGIYISIHAPPRGATFLLSLVRPSSTISIHAPPRGATRQPAALWHKHRNFNSRPSARGDRQAQPWRHTPQSISIHAPPRGATRCSTSAATP